MADTISTDEQPAHVLSAKVPFSRRLPCYMCGAPPPPGGHTKDHVPAQWLYDKGRGDTPPPDWPTAPLCMMCKEATDAADNELHRCTAVRGGHEAPAWQAFRRGFQQQRRVLASLATRARLLFSVQAWGGWWRSGFRYDAKLLDEGLKKLAAGLIWAIDGERLQSDIVIETGHESLAATFRGVEHFHFGSHFSVCRARSPEEPQLQIFDVTYYGRARWSIALMPPHVAELVEHQGAVGAVKP